MKFHINISKDNSKTNDIQVYQFEPMNKDRNLANKIMEPDKSVSAHMQGQLGGWNL